MTDGAHSFPAGADWAQAVALWARAERKARLLREWLGLPPEPNAENAAPNPEDGSGDDDHLA